MQKTLITLLSLFIVNFSIQAQQLTKKVFTSDIDNFWATYDSCQNTNDSLKQVEYFKKNYVAKGTEGLRAFMLARGYSPELWVKLIRKYPKFWNSIRKNTLTVKSMAKEIGQSIERLKMIYPELKEAKIYFTIGGLNSGGTTMNNLVLIGAEVATGDSTTDVSEFSDKWLAGVFKSQSVNNTVFLNIHEYVHTQQIGTPQNLLGQAIKEGSCDFITELVMKKPLQNNYIVYGRGHENELKGSFKKDMFTSAYSNWLYNGAAAQTVADLGYFMGYDICKSYYNNSSDKKKAIKNIIELNYSDTAAIENFLAKAKYYTELINKQELIEQFERHRPYVLRIEPFANNDSLVDPSIKEIKIIFSEPMNIKSYSFNYSERGKNYYPIVSVTNFSNDGTSLTLKVDLQPDHDYEFVVSDRSFKSSEGYPLRPFNVKFKTKRN